MDGDGYINRSEMEAYLTAVFRVLYEAEPDTERRMGMPPGDLAIATARSCFEEADRDRDGRLSLHEFKTWYLATGDAPMRNTVISAASATPSWFTLNEVKRLTNLSAYNVDDVMQVIGTYTDDEGYLDHSAFNNAFAALVGAQTAAEARRTHVVLSRLFSLFDLDGKGRVHFTELVSGLSVLIGGPREHKLRAAFALFDADGDGFISREEMTSYLISVFKVLYEVNPGTADRVGVAAPHMAAITTDECFREADLNHDGRLSFEEFEAWYSSPASGPGADGARRAVSTAASVPPFSVVFDEIRRLTDIGDRPTGDVVDAFALASNEDNLLSRGAFRRVMLGLMTPHSAAERQHALSYIDQLFRLFDRNNE